MPAIGSIKTSSILGTLTRTSSATVGFDKTFCPEGIDTKGVSRWVDRSGGIAVNFPSISLSSRRPTKTSRMYKVMLKVAMPTPDITSPSTGSGIQPAPSKAYDNVCIIEFLLPERGTTAERLALFNHVHSLFCSTINASDDLPTDATGSPLLAVVQDLDTIY
jgi:hypothetical protein